MNYAFADILWWMAIYSIGQTITYLIHPVEKKGWPVSAYLFGVLHQLIVLPTLWMQTDIHGCLRSSTAYFLTDFALHHRRFDSKLLFHHVLCVFCCVLNPYVLTPDYLHVATRWLVLFEMGSSTLNLTDLTGQFYTLRLYAYGSTRLGVLLQIIWNFPSVMKHTGDTVMMILFLMIIGHNMCILSHFWRSHQKRNGSLVN